MRFEHAVYLLSALLLAGALYGAYSVLARPAIGPVGSAHMHADVKMYVNGVAIDFSQPAYQLRSAYVHFEDGDGNVLHVHATGVTMGFFLNTLGMALDGNCLAIGNGRFCNGGGKTPKFYVNGRINGEYERYVIKDLDKILISYGAEGEAEIRKQLDSVTDLARGQAKGAD